jgi:hypothetical protein
VEDEPPPIAARTVFGAIIALLLGCCGFCGSFFAGAQEWLADHGAGDRGVVTLTEQLGCSHYDSPKKPDTCGWFGDFRSDDGTVLLHRVELSGGLPIGTGRVGDQIPARAVRLFPPQSGLLPQVYREGDTQGWHDNLPFVLGFGGALVIGVLLTQPWWWRRRYQLWRQGWHRTVDGWSR